MTIPASVYIITKDAARHLRRALESVADFAEIIVLDSGSSDETCAIAREYTDKVIFQEWLGFSRQKTRALSLCRHEWVLNLDADEEVSSELRAEIVQTINENAVDALSIPFDDRFCFSPNHAWVQRVSKVRFFRKSVAHYGDETVHEGVSIDGRVVTTRGVIVHYGESSIAVKVDKNNFYSSLRSAQDFQGGRSVSAGKILVAFPLAFWRSYLLRRQCFNGMNGFIASMINGFYAFLKAAKLYESRRRDPSKTE